MPRKTAVSRYLSEIGRKGGKASVKSRLVNLTPEQRSAIAKKAAEARWKKAKKKPNGKNESGS
jgi:hypothetical protein